jgi:hypothetical protein
VAVVAGVSGLAEHEWHIVENRWSLIYSGKFKAHLKCGLPPDDAGFGSVHIPWVRTLHGDASVPETILDNDSSNDFAGRVRTAFPEARIEFE